MMSKGTRLFRLNVLAASLLGLPLAGVSWAAHINTSTHTPAKSKSQTKISESQHTRRRLHHLAHARSATPATSAGITKVSVSPTSRTTRRRHSYERFHMSSFAEDITAGDITTGEDPVVRQAAIDALGNMNGTVVAIEPTSGRVLAMVNQKLALSSGAQPCSTIKLSVALAALSEGLISKDTPVALGGRYRMNLTEALAHSNNAYFEAVGSKLGFEKVAYYAHQYGLGELAGYDISGEQLGSYPDEAIPAKAGRRWQDVLLRRRRFHDPAATGRDGFGDRQWGNALLFAASDDSRRSRGFSAAGEAPAGHRSRDS